MATSLTFINKSKGTMHLYWINYLGKRQVHTSLKPGKSVRLKTFVGHPWVVTNSQGKTLGIYVARPQPGTVKLGI